MQTKDYSENIVDVKKIVEEKKEELKIRINKLKKKNIIPKLAVILANDLDSSRIYVNNKRKLCKELNVEEVEYILEKDTNTKKVLDIIEKLNNDPSVDGILVQLPIFEHLNKEKILNSISAKKDVDGFHPLNLGMLLSDQKSLVACTPKGIEYIIDSLKIDIEGKTAVVVGRSIIVGKPISQLLLNRDATVITCHSKTENLRKYTKMADILVVAAGFPHLITKGMVKEGAVVIDVGINRKGKKIVGDVDTKNVAKKAKYVTPVPGGVGITTVTALIDNLVSIAEQRVKS